MPATLIRSKVLSDKRKAKATSRCVSSAISNSYHQGARDDLAIASEEGSGARAQRLGVVLRGRDRVLGLCRATNDLANVEPSSLRYGSSSADIKINRGRRLTPTCADKVIKSSCAERAQQMCSTSGARGLPLVLFCSDRPLWFFAIKFRD